MEKTTSIELKDPEKTQTDLPMTVNCTEALLLLFVM